MKQQIAGIDIGYNAVKAFTEKNGFSSFPSIVGSPDAAGFSARGDSDEPIEINGVAFRYGKSALIHSAMPTRQEDRNWIQSEQYVQLFGACLHELFNKSAEVRVVTGLPIKFMADSAKLHKSICQKYEILFSGKRKTFVVHEDSLVVPQPFGTILHVAMDNDGDFADAELMLSRIGIIDIGGKTTNFLYTEAMQEVGFQSESIDAGGWDIARAVGDFITEEFPDLELRDHEIAEAISNGYVRVFGKVHDITHITLPIINRMVSQIVGQATTLWNRGGRIDRLLITGGGSLMLGRQVSEAYGHGNTILVDGPVSANAKGYYKFALQKNKRGW